MSDAMNEKFNQNIDLKNVLILTKNAQLIHLSGRFKKPVRFNNLEKIRAMILMKIKSNELQLPIIMVNQNLNYQEANLLKFLIRVLIFL